MKLEVVKSCVVSVRFGLHAHMKTHVGMIGSVVEKCRDLSINVQISCFPLPFPSAKI